MKALKLVSFLLLSSCALSAAAQTPAPPVRHNLMPVPSSVRFGSGRLAIDKTFTVAANGHVDERLRAGIDRAMRRLEGRTVLELARGLSTDAASAKLLIEARGPGRAVPSVEEDESYTLEVNERQATLRAPTVVGALRGLETFLQLLDGDREGFYVPAVSIDDRPRFRWRGLLIDISRHFEPMDVLKRNLDAMAAVKLNVFHWHLTEDQGFRIESKKFPKLHQMGSDGNFYTQEQAREVIAYAAARGIRVVPEFDMPGHATAWVVGHPELASAPGPYTIERRPGIFEPTLDPTREEVYKLLDGFLGEMAALFPDAYMHIGGDENTGKQWDANPQIQAFMKEKGLKDNHALQTYFNQRLLKILQKHGKRMMGWDEIFQPELPKDVVIHSWRGSKALAEAARRGYDGVLSNGYYIDLTFPASAHYLNDPLPEGHGLTDAEAAHVLGGEATMWGEWVTPETIDSRIWPRTAAIAERLWSPREVRDVEDMYRRLRVVSVRLEELGLTHERNQAMMLRRLAGGADTRALETLVSVVEPVKEYRRYQQRPQTMLSPLTGLVDAARPDAPGARDFSRRVDLLLSDAPRFAVHVSTLRDTLVSWRDARPSLEILIDRSPGLAEARPLARDLAAAGEIGLEALLYLLQRGTPPARWGEPVKEYRRYQQRPQTMLSPLTGLVDAARPDAAGARDFSRRVDLLLSDAPRFAVHVSTLRDTLVSWRDARPSLEILIDRSPGLAEARPLARDLAAAGEIGLEALLYLSQRVTPPAEWRDARLAALAEVEKPKAALEFPFLPALRELVHAAAEQSALRDTTPADWRKRVRELANPPRQRTDGH